MKKSLLVFSFLLLTKLSFGCDCSPPNIFLEFYASKYVFTGKVVSKIYAPDSLTYTFTIEIDKHYKDGGKPKSLSFTWRSEAYIRKDSVVSDCDYEVNIDDSLFVFSQIRSSKLTFGLNCSNSSRWMPGLNQQKQLESAKNFKILDFHINFDYTLFNTTQPVTDINNLIKPYQKKVYGNKQVTIMFDVDTNGNVTNSNILDLYCGLAYNKPDSILYINDIINKKYRDPKNELEKDTLKIAQKIRKWDVMRFKIGNQAVKSRQYISFYVDKYNKLQWSKFCCFLN